MNVFDLRRRVIEDYSQYVTSFVRIRDDRIRAHVEQELERGLLWPPARVQLNPTFAPGGSVDELVADGLLHPACAEIFRAGKTAENPHGHPMRLHRHQREAIEAAGSGASYVLTTGTGSGKSLAYIVPIVDRVLREGSGRGIRAIVVYPMNALANSQMGELEKFLGREAPAVKFARYTGQESQEEREAVRTSPPDVLLTNYVMLELILTRYTDRHVVTHASGLRFLVLDELHTYRGRQGADVAMLVRRVREACHADGLQCVGTSATLAGEGGIAEQRAQVAQVASRVFGTSVTPAHVIGETLERATAEVDPVDARAALADRVRGTVPAPTDFAALRSDALASWLETTVGLARDADTGTLVRQVPRPISGAGGAAADLAEATGLPVEDCSSALEDALLAGHAIDNTATGRPAFAFRLHQFISRGDTVRATLEPESVRRITAEGLQWAPGKRARYFPVVFCRECGQEYYSVRRLDEQGQATVVPRDPSERFSDDEATLGYVYASADRPWPDDEAATLERLPEDWLEEFRGALRVRPASRAHLPDHLALDPAGAADGGGLPCVFIPAPFRLCLRCGVSYTGRLGSDFARLATLGSGGRSTATTVLGTSLVRTLRADHTLERGAQKLLSFTDNRQDASLQAGHFNDFIEVALIRAALHRAVADAGPKGLAHDELAAAVTRALALPAHAYAVNPQAKYGALEETDRALRELVGYRLYRDLRRGWRITAPNLEQCGLLHIDYAWLDQLCEDEAEWAATDVPALAAATPAQRAHVCRALLDTLRRDLAIAVDYLDRTYQEGMRQRSNAQLTGRWALDESEQSTMEFAAVAYPRSRGRNDPRTHAFVSPRGGFGRFLRRPGILPAPPRADGTEAVIRALLEALLHAGIVRRIEGSGGDHGYQVQASAICWCPGDGSPPPPDPIRVPSPPTDGEAQTNAFFSALYRGDMHDAVELEAHEHTAQVSAEERLERESAFREGRLPVLFCSPTMELGVDISDLPVVNMRNVPPTPANYAQRSGRAGRAGQPALVVTYCTTGSTHDQYFFRRPERMVRGQVAPPRLDLTNEDLLRAHVHAIWLAATGASLGRALPDILDLDDPGLPLKPDTLEDLQRPSARAEARARAHRVLETLVLTEPAMGHLDDAWLDQVLAQAVAHLDRACDRWRTLRRAAKAQADSQHAIIHSAATGYRDRQIATRLRREAEAQLMLLEGSDRNVQQSDFNTYRYLAAEGFLPGYNFPRLPLSAFIPARRGPRRGTEGEYLNRPRFLAIREFGPRSILYHEGARYVVNQVILPVEDREDGAALPLRTIKRCEACGYAHPIDGGALIDACERCGAAEPAPVTRLLRLTNVATRRRDRINSDEEERTRLGYDLATAFRFASRSGEVVVTAARTMRDGDPGWSVSYGPAATIWRINLGWARRKQRDQLGFVLDVERGYWAKESESVDDPDDPLSARQERVVPFVEDTRNTLVLEPPAPLDRHGFWSLMTALKNGIQVAFQLEDSEIAAEPLPDAEAPAGILFFEASEGGAGVLRRLVEEPDALARAAREALALCHFDPVTGDDLRQAPNATEPCEAACYDCLLSYGNQRVHGMLDRLTVLEPLLALAASRVSTGQAPAGRLADLLAQAESSLERDWLRTVADRGLRLPDRAQVLEIEERTRPDFVYDVPLAAIYVDGPKHEHPDRAQRDRDQDARMGAKGYRVARFTTDRASWDAVFSQHAAVFGATPGGGGGTAGPTVPVEPSHQVPAIDLDLYPRSWHPLLSALAGRGLVVSAGGDVSDGSNVVGSCMASVLVRGERIRLLDAGAGDAQAVREALEDQGAGVVQVDPAAVDAAVLAILGEAS